MKSLIKYLLIREKSILSLLAKAKNNYSSATFHQLRLEIKKLNALLDLIDNCLRHFNCSKWSKPFTLIFKKAGKVRDLQVGEALVAPYFKTIHHQAYRNLLQQEQGEAKQEFFEWLENSNKKEIKKAFRKIKASLKEVDSLMVNAYMLKKEKRIKSILLQSHLKAENIHDLRKRLKKYYYNKNSLDYKKPIILFHDAETLQELMGKWQDCFILMTHLNKAMKYGNIDLAERKHLKQVQKKVSTLKASLFNKIKLAIPKLHLLKQINTAA